MFALLFVFGVFAPLLVLVGPDLFGVIFSFFFVNMMTETTTIEIIISMKNNRKMMTPVGRFVFPFATEDERDLFIFPFLVH